MVNITFDMIKKKAEHHRGSIAELQEISLHQLNIEGINTVLGNTSKHLRILYLQNNLIPKLENLHKLKELEYLNVALNNITKIENLESCEKLRKLDLTVNFVDVDSLVESVENLKDCASLRELYLTGNPCTTFTGYRAYVIASLPTLNKLDGTEISKSERIAAIQSLATVRRELEQAAAVRRIQRDASSTEDESDSAFTPEARLKMYRETQAEEEKKKKADTFAAPADPFKEAQQKLSKKVIPPEDGSLPPQRNVGKVDFEFSEDNKNNIVVDISVPRFLDTSEIEVDVHPQWFQVLIKGKNLLLHTPEEVNADNVTVKRLPTNGHLVLTLPKTKPSTKSYIAEGARKGGMSVEQTDASVSKKATVRDNTAKKVDTRSYEYLMGGFDEPVAITRKRNDEGAWKVEKVEKRATVPAFEGVDDSEVPPLE